MEGNEFSNMGKGALALTALAVIVLVGVAIISTMGDSNTFKDVTAVVNDSFTGDKDASVALTYDDIIASSFSVQNTTGDAQTNYTLDADAGTILVGSDLDEAELLADYNYYADSYVTTTGVYFGAGLLVFATFASLIVLVYIGKILIGLIKKE